MLAWLVFLSLIIADCASDMQGPERVFVIRVQRVEAPESIAPDQPLPLAFHGMIGPDLCHVFDRFEALQSASRLDLTLHGRFEGGGACAQAISELRGRQFVKSPPHAGTEVLVVVHQPDGSTLQTSVQIVR
jgi:hypothetical protein